MGYEGGPNLRVQRINGKATQEHIQIRLAPYFDNFGEEGEDGNSLPRLSFGTSFEFEGYETGGFVGVPSKAYQRANRMIQTSGFYFCHELKVYHGKKIDPIVWSPADFVDRSALIAGRALNEEKAAVISGKNWKLLVNKKVPWPAEHLGKEVEAYGFIRKSTGGRFSMEAKRTNLVRLEDQLGKKVSLRGTPWSANDNWWYDYRGTDMYVDGMKEMSGWTGDLRGKPILIEGVLEEAVLPDLEANLGRFGTTPKKYFVVRHPSWKPCDALLSPEVSRR